MHIHILLFNAIIDQAILVRALFIYLFIYLFYLFILFVTIQVNAILKKCVSLFKIY